MGGYPHSKVLICSQSLNSTCSFPRFFCQWKATHSINHNLSNKSVMFPYYEAIRYRMETKHILIHMVIEIEDCWFSFHIPLYCNVHYKKTFWIITNHFIEPSTIPIMTNNSNVNTAYVTGMCYTRSYQKNNNPKTSISIIKI